MNREDVRGSSPIPASRSIRNATTADVLQLAELLAQAFLRGPVADWLVPDTAERLPVYRAYFAMWAEDAVRWGRVEVNYDLTCAALWYPAGRAGGRPDDYERRLAALAGPHLERFKRLDSAFAAVHPEEDHDYLAFLGVAPERQGMGQGSRMLRHHHVQLDNAQRSAYLEASNVHNRALYLRHGYEDIGQIRLPDGPTLWPMWRKPAPPAITQEENRQDDTALDD